MSMIIMHFQRLNLVVHQFPWENRTFMYHVYANRTQAKKNAILILAQFSGKGRHTPHYVLWEILEHEFFLH